MRRRLVLFALLPLLAAGCAEDLGGGGSPVATTACDAVPPAADPAWKAERPRVRLNTTHGDVVLALDLERAPIPAQNFLNLTQQGFYDGVTFHRVVSGFVIQGGDPLSKDDDPRNDGGGGPGHQIPDQFNPTLRHDGAGTLSMATAGPDTGGSQFFVTLTATPALDDRHSVFGEVVEGLDVVEAIGRVPTTDRNGDGRREEPVDPVVILTAAVVAPEPFEPAHAVGVHAVLDRKTTEAGRAVTFAVVLRNQGNVRDAVALSATVPEGWSCRVSEPPVIPAGTGRVAFLTVTPPAGATGEAPVALRATSAHAGAADATDEVVVVLGTLGEQVRSGNIVRGNYAGFLPDGRLFDTSFAQVANDPDMPKFETPGGWRARPSYEAFTFTVGGNVIPGFTNLALTAREGETVTAPIPAADAYAQGDMYQRPLTGRDLVFELEILEAS